MATSKEVSSKKTSSEMFSQAVKDQMKQTLSWVSLCHGISDSIAKLSSPMFVYELTNGNVGDAAAFFALINTSMSLCEFLFNPLFGQLSDAYGRRVVLLLWPAINPISRICVAMFTSKKIYMAQQVSVKMLEYIFEKGISCSITDMLDGDERSIANGKINFMREGVGVLLGSLIGGYIAATYGHRAAYYICACSSFVAYLLMQYRMIETLAVEKRKPVNMEQAMNPLRFLDLLNGNSKYNKNNNCAGRKLAIVFAIQKGTNKGVEQQLNVFTRDNLGWDARMTSFYKVYQGITGMVSGQMVKYMLNAVGPKGSVWIGNIFSAIAWLLIGTAKQTWQVFAGLTMLLPFGAYKRPALETELSTIADKNNIGQGKLQADLANLVAVIKIVSPMIYLSAYNWGKASFGSSSVPFFLYAGYFVASSVLYLQEPKYNGKTKNE
jgi:MFS transporter, DHA1 family, tetracycline resistance protein